MKNFIKKAAKLSGIAVTASFAILTAIYFLQTRATASGTTYKAVTAEYVETSEEVEQNTSVEATEEATVATVEATEATAEATEAATEKATEAQTQAPTEAATEAVTQAPTEAVTAAPTQAATEAQTQAPTEAATEAPTQTPVQTAQPAQTTTYTNVVFKDAYNTYNFSSLEEAKASINVKTLSDSEAKAQAIANKTTYASEVNTLVDLINSYRKANGLAALKLNDNITTAAMHRAAESAYADWNMTAMENGTTKRHIRPNFQKASSIAATYGISGSFGENYGRFFQTPEEILEGWQNSSAHNGLLLSSGYSQIGIGVAADSEGYLYWVAIFN